MTTATHRSLAEPFSTGASWLSRAVTVSIVLHVIVAGVWWAATKPAEKKHVTTVDIEMAPPPPPVEALPAEVAKPPESAPETAQANTAPTPADEPEDELLAVHDAGVDAPVDAAVDAGVKKRRADAAIDGGDGVDATPMNVAEDLGDGGVGDGNLLALADAGVLEGDGAVVAASESGSGAGSGVGMGSGSEGSGVAGATETGSGSGVAGVDNLPAVDGAPTTAGTAANLLAYFPPGHQVTALVRFDRLRGTEWAEPAEALFRPMPDYQGLFGSSAASIADKFDTLVISSPSPQDVNATTLVVHSKISRAKLREFLTNPRTPIAWSATTGGMYGRRSGHLFPNDKRVLLSPWRDWIVLAQPEDLPGLTTRAKGSLDTIEAKAKLPPWLQTIRTIEQESGDEKTKGPALVLTLAGPGTRYEIPDIGLGITSLPSPDRITVAMEVVQQGWLIRGNIVFAKEADAKEFETSVTEVRQRVLDSRILSGLLKKQHALNVVTNLSVARTQARVSYSTSVSIADMHAILVVAAAALGNYFGGKQQPP